MREAAKGRNQGGGCRWERARCNMVHLRLASGLPIPSSQVESRVKSSQVKSSKSNSNLFYTVVGHSVFPCPVFRSSHPGSYKSPLPMSHLTSILCNGTGSKTPGGAGTPRDRHKNLTNQPQTITVPVKRHRGEPGHTRGTQDTWGRPEFRKAAIGNFEGILSNRV